MGRPRPVTVIAVSVALLTACSSSVVGPTVKATGTPSSQAHQTVVNCATYTGHRYEACFAYVWNDAHWSLQPYYKYAHSDSIFAFLKDRLPLKYKGQALAQIQHRTANWPSGTNIVDGPHIAILQADSSLACNRAVLVTREDWTVISPNGAVLYREQQQVHTVILHRVPDERFRFGNYVLHAWVVYAIYNSRRDIPVC